ncbi:MAG: hypothetical protein ABIO04_01125 [Ferruginibacter sp.]
MRTTFLLAFAVCIFCACKKDKFTTEPQIEYKSVRPNYTSVEVGSTIPEITFGITDAQGDLGLKTGSDTSFIYLTNNRTGRSDSLPFPDLGASGKSNFKADVSVSISTVLECIALPSGNLHIDTLFFDIYVRDFAKNKSNVITSEPIYFNCR